LQVLITGADGLLGSNLVRELLGQGHAVRVFLQPGSRSTTLAGLDLTKIEGDLLDGGPVLSSSIKGCDAVFHLAAITDPRADAGLTWKVNYEGARKVLDACLDAAVKKLVFVGSASSFQFGTLDRPGDETCPFPDAYRGYPYMESKHRAAALVKDYVREKGLDAVIVCPTFMIGAYDSRPSSGEIIRQFIVRKPPAVPPGGRSFVCVQDAARAAAAALTKGRRGETYILGGHNLTYMDFFTKVAEVSGQRPPKAKLPASLILLGGAAGSLYEKVTGRPPLINLPLARLAPLGTYYSSAKAVAELGMVHTPIEQGIREAIDGLREYGHLPGK